MRKKVNVKRNDSTSYHQSHENSYFVHCVEDMHDQDSNKSRVVVEWDHSNDSEDYSSLSKELSIRFKCPIYPKIGSFYLLFYEDPYHSNLHEVWQVFVHTRIKVETHGPVGSVTKFDLVVKGDRERRRTRSYASNFFDVIEFIPSNVFQLVPEHFNRISVKYKPLSVGSRTSLINLVDVDTRKLVTGWILVASSTVPSISRSYEVEVFSTQEVSKKIIFKNPWDFQRKFQIVSSDENLMKSRDKFLQIEGNGSAYLRLMFNKVSPEDIHEVYLFLNDDNGQCEECFLFVLNSK